jgi:hypothetical protein
VSDYNIGDLVRISCVFTVSGTPADPTAVTAKVKAGDGTVTAYTSLQVSKDSTGHYHVDVPLTKAGCWTYRFEATGTVVAAAEEAFNVRTSAFY